LGHLIVSYASYEILGLLRFPPVRSHRQIARLAARNDAGFRRADFEAAQVV
jgi:hypothetical protein